MSVTLEYMVDLSSKLVILLKIDFDTRINTQDAHIHINTLDAEKTILKNMIAWKEGFHHAWFTNWQCSLSIYTVAITFARTCFTN